MIMGLNLLSTLKGLKVNREARAGHCVACLSANAFHGLCAPCRADLPVNRWSCYTCGLPLPWAADKLRCGECTSEPPPFDRARIPWRYQFPVDGMIGRYKYHGQRKFVRPLVADFGQFLARQLAVEPALAPLTLVPAPMHPRRRRERGFNQATDIAEQLGRQLDIPVDSGLVRRVRQVRSQRELNRAQRLANLKDVFEIRGTPPPRVAIVDDVVTTGATARALAMNLKAAGTRKVEIWALARTPG